MRGVRRLSPFLFLPREIGNTTCGLFTNRALPALGCISRNKDAITPNVDSEFSPSLPIFKSLMFLLPGSRANPLPFHASLRASRGGCLAPFGDSLDSALCKLLLSIHGSKSIVSSFRELIFPNRIACFIIASTVTLRMALAPTILTISIVGEAPPTDTLGRTRGGTGRVLSPDVWNFGLDEVLICAHV